jgi:hypothetical protein
VTPEQFADSARMAGGTKQDQRDRALTAMRALPPEEAVEHLQSAWQSGYSSGIRRLRLSQVGVFVGSITMACVVTFLFFWSRFGPQPPKTREVMDLLSVASFAQAAALMLIMFRGNYNFAHGLLFVAVNLPYPALAPQLIEALKDTNWLLSGGENWRAMIQTALGKLLPEYARLDRAELSPRQKQILAGELERYARRLRSPHATLEPEEGAFLVGLLAYLRAEDDRKAPTAASAHLETLMQEPTGTRESPERQAVREAARVAYLRLYG